MVTSIFFFFNIQLKKHGELPWEKKRKAKHSCETIHCDYEHMWKRLIASWGVWNASLWFRHQLMLCLTVIALKYYRLVCSLFCCELLHLVYLQTWRIRRCVKGILILFCIIKQFTVLVFYLLPHLEASEKTWKLLSACLELVLFLFWRVLCCHCTFFPFKSWEACKVHIVRILRNKKQ